MQGGIDTLWTLGGGAATRMATNLLPLPKEGLTGTAVSLLAAVGIGMLARQFVSPDAARFITAGGMQVPVKNLILSFAPQAAGLLGDYAIEAYLPHGGVSGYLDNGNPNDAYVGEQQLGAYVDW